MFKSMSIPKKLGLSFVMINVTAAIMMLVFFVNVSMIRSLTDSNNLAQSIHADALSLETAILRQNSQFRGFLVTGDESYLKSYYEGRDDYDRISAKLETTLTDPAQKQLVRESRAATLSWRENWGDRMIEWVKAGRREEAAQAVRAAGKAVLVSKPVLPLRAIRDAQQTSIKENSAWQESAIATALTVLVIGGIALVGLGIFLSRLLSRSIAMPISALTRTMAELAQGRNDTDVPGAHRADELGDMARAVQVFRDAAIEKAAADEHQKHVVTALGDALGALADGDMTYTIDQPFAPHYEALRDTFNRSVMGLETSLRQVAQSSASVRSGATEIRAASEDLSIRTERQAATLEETNASMNQVTDMVAETAHSAIGVRSTIDTAHRDASEGEEVVRKAVSAMGAIEKSSQEIGQIINVIDGIAFQTNLLALNAGVEAARAGDAGKGFAVVANEVRALAQRSADAAKDIKQLINMSGEQVAEGVARVDETGRMLGRIVAKIREINGLIADIANSAETQADNLRSVNRAVVDMDNTTQQNAAMVEQTTAAARSLAGEADQLAALVSRFRLQVMEGERSDVGKPVRPAAAPRPAAFSAPRTRGNLGLKLAPDEESWTDF
jgi:methyl-accepting chemotaxis protein